MNIIMLGPPGAGKGTQAKFISGKFSLPHISTGDMLRDEMERKTDLGKKVEEIINAGKLVKDDLMVAIIKKRLSQPDTKSGFILDGFPRTVSQARSLDEILKSMGKRIEFVLYVEVSEDVIVKRLSSRRICPKCGRVYNIISNPPHDDNLCDVCHASLIIRRDDKPETVRNRYRVYLDLTLPVIEYYRKRNVLFTIDGTLPVEKVKDMVLNILGGAK